MTFEDEYKPKVLADFLIVLSILRITQSSSVEEIFYNFVETGKFI